MNLDAIARAQRRRQVLDALEVERQRESALAEQLEETIAELEGPRIDEEVFAGMAPEDVAIVRQWVLGSAEDVDQEVPEDWLDEADSPEAEREERLAEIARLEEEIAASRRRQEAFERYLQSLASGADPEAGDRPTGRPRRGTRS